MTRPAAAAIGRHEEDAVLLYVTIDDVLNEPKAPGGPERAPAGAPETLAALYDRAMRHHDRRIALVQRLGGQAEEWPDWKLDRQVIRVALYCREHLQVAPGDRVVVFGPLHRLWPVADFAAMGLGAVPVGVEHAVTDDVLERALADAAARVAVATDGVAAERLLRLRERASVPETVVVPGDGEGRPGALPLARLQELAATLDTAERAQSFRAASRAVVPDAAALWHLAPDGPAGGFVRLTHRDALALALTRAQQEPARPGDVACVEGERATLAARLACHAWVGDGLSTLALGVGTAEDVARLRPHRLLASAAWLERAFAEVETGPGGAPCRLARRLPSWLARLVRRSRPVRRAWQRLLGDRLRAVETTGALSREAADALAWAGLRDGYAGAGSETALQAGR